jgi:hypothetical protein
MAAALWQLLLRVLIRVASVIVDPAGPSRLRLRLHVTAARLRHQPGRRR